MTQQSLARPVWAARSSLRAIWVATGESPEWIARRTDAFLTILGSALEIPGWETPQRERWEGPFESLVDIVQRHVTVGTFGDKEPESGYFFTVSGTSQQIGLHVRVSAGSQWPGRRVPLHTVTIDLRELVSGAVTGQVGDTLCAAVAEAWTPLTLSLSDPLVNSTARRGGWKIPVGYRTWVSSEVGSITQLAEGLTATELAAGTLISAPDDWPADRVVAAMIATLADNGLDEIPH